MASVSREVNRQHKSLMIKLCDMMDPNDPTYKNFIYYLESYLPEGMLDRVQQNPTDVFRLMEKRGILKAGDYHKLKEALKASGYINVLDVLKNEEECIARQMRKRSYTDGSMACGSLNIDTATVSSIEPEDISKLRGDLIQAYRNLRCVQVSPLFEKRRFDIDNIYVDLVIEEKQEGSNTQGRSKYVYTQSNVAHSHSKEPIKVTSYKQIFVDGRGSKLKRIYLRGKGGLGKTTFCRKVLHAWCNVHEGRVVVQDSFFQDETVLMMFDLLFYLNLREVSVEETLIEVICAQFPLEDVPNKIILGTLMKEYGDKILFILDGLDEMIVKAKFLENIVTRRVYPNCCFLISSRPWKIAQMELHEGTEIDLLLDLKGFSWINALKFAENIFINCYNDGNIFKQFEADIARIVLAKQLIHVPLLLLFLAVVWYENQKVLPSKLCELYVLFLNLVADRMKEKYKKDPNYWRQICILGDTQFSLPSKISASSLVVNFGEGFLLSLCEVAHHFLLSNEKENSLLFEETELLKAFGDKGEEKLCVALQLGLLSVTDSVSNLYMKTNVSFIHKTMQEFFTALYFIIKPEKLEKFILSLVDLTAVQQNENIIIFLVGLMPKLGSIVLEKVNELCSDCWKTSRSGDSEGELVALEMCQSRHRNEVDISQMLAKEAMSHLLNISDIYCRCQEEVIGEDVLLNISGLCLRHKNIDLHSLNLAFIQSLDVNWTGPISDMDYVLVNLKGLEGLTYLRLCSLNCDLYLPQTGSLTVLILKGVKLSISCCEELGKVLGHCTRLERLNIHCTNLHNCVLDLSNMSKLTSFDIEEVSLSSSCCTLLYSTLAECIQLESLKIFNEDLQNCLLDLSNMTELRDLYLSKVTLSFCSGLSNTLTCCVKMKNLRISNTDLQSCLLDLSAMTDLTELDMYEVMLSRTCCDILGSTLTRCTKLEKLSIHSMHLHNCLLDVANMTKLIILVIINVTLSSSCCDVFSRTLTHCTKLERLDIRNTDLHNYMLNLSNMTELTDLDLRTVTLSSGLTHCTKLERLSIFITDPHSYLLDLSNMTQLISLDISGVTLSQSLMQCTKLHRLGIFRSNLQDFLLDFSTMTELTVLDMLGVNLSIIYCDALGNTLTLCTKLETLTIRNTDLHNCLLDLSGKTELTSMELSKVALSSRCCDVLGKTLTCCTKLMTLRICNTDLHNCWFDLSKLTELRYLMLWKVNVSSDCCDALCSMLTHCTKLETIDMHVNGYFCSWNACRDPFESIEFLMKKETEKLADLKL
ncbi:hypothetical protein ACJMK2_040094 [Sinanodonta woodiana]|uniref:Uncharacterized protein n=1 Tax=Sinanodonta woodiana TaxID=1069815 RepID=A0ABD3WDY3_SINWO